MDNENLLENIFILREKADNNKLVIFVGSGVSLNTPGMSSWYGIIDEMATAAKYSRCKYCYHKKRNCKKNCQFIKDYTSDEYLKIPQYLYNKNQRKYWKILNKSITDPDVEAPMSSAIFEINPAHIITTNYDKLLEASNHIYSKQYDVIVEERDLLVSDKGKYIIKMHGDLEYPKTVVLKERDYLDYSQNHVLVELFIKSLLTDHTFLFLGYSLNDYNIKLIISWLNYMRSENNAIDKNHKAGYIVFDKKIDKIQKDYFENNNIGVITIDNIPILNDIPSKITKEIGKRLYSFLKIVANPALDVKLSANTSLNRAITLIKKYSFINYKSLLKILHISPYDFTDGSLRIYNASAYNMVEEFLNANDTNANELRRILINAGINNIIDSSRSNSNNIIKCGGFEESELFNDDFYQLYLENNYDELKKLIEKSGNKDLIKICFYYSIINGYKYAFEELPKINLDTIDDSQKIAFLHNSACLKKMDTFFFNSNNIIRYIDNISNINEREIHKPYIDLYSGNTDSRLIEEEEYSKIKIGEDRNTVHVGCSGSYSLSRIKRISMDAYYFFFYNYIFFNGFNDLNTILKPYVLSLIYLSSPSRNNKQSFNLSVLDIDIITKFTKTKELYEALDSSNINEIILSEKLRTHFVNCFCNLSRSIYEANLYGYRLAFINHLSNLALVLSKTSLENDDKNRISKAVNQLFSSKQFGTNFFNIQLIDYKQCLHAFADLINHLALKPSFDFIEYMLSLDDFYTYSVNVNFQKLRRIVEQFIGTDPCGQNKMKRIIDSEVDFNKKIIILRLFYKKIDDENIKKEYSSYLLDNFDSLSRDAIYDFVFDQWIKPTEKNLKTIFMNIIEMQKEREKQEKRGMFSYPNYVDMRLEQVYLLYIDNVIKDISPLEEISSQKPHLDFLLHPDTFDYTKVDFSDYMWMNFARQKKYMDIFVEHKNEIRPRLIEKYKSELATEDEKKILIKYMIDDEELWGL